MQTYILLFQCRDKKGIVAKISDFILRHDGNIITADQHSTDPQNGHFFMRVEFVSFRDKKSLEADFSEAAIEFDAGWELYDRAKNMRMGIFVSTPGHCLFELLYLWKTGELNVEIPFVASNSEIHKGLVEQFKVPFYFVPSKKDDRREDELMALAKDTDFLVLSRYMLVLSKSFLNSYGKEIINIHHGFLPSFKGANPYKQALEKGVKVIGATAHFVNESLDEGPIITQIVEEVSHKDDLNSLVRKGKNLEKAALAKAVACYLEHRVIKYGNTTIVF